MSTEPLDVMNREYAAGFVTDIESDTFAPGLDEDVVRRLSAKTSGCGRR
jgi:Fe-S cluster assembly protein SufB